MCGNKANTMAAFFSGTDDKYELGDPGIHLVVGGIKAESRKYEIAASVVGGGRRFVMHYDNLIDATPVESVIFHPKVIDYVDYTSPIVSTYTQYKGGVTANSVKKISGSDYNSYQQWLKQYSSYGDSNDSQDWNDPYFYSENCHSYNYGTVKGGREVKFWEVEDILNDYIHQSQNSLNSLVMLKETLQGMLIDIEAGIDLHLESN